MTVLGWEAYSGSPVSIRSTQKFTKAEIYQTFSTPPGQGPSPATRTMLSIVGNGSAYLRPTGGVLNGKSTLAYNEGIMECWFVPQGFGSNAGTTWWLFKADGLTNYYRVAWTGTSSGTLEIRRTLNTSSNTTLASVATTPYPRWSKWAFVRIYWWWKDTAKTQLGIRVEGDDGQGGGVTLLSEVTDSSPLADSTTCSFGIGGFLNGLNNDIFYFGALNVRPRPGPVMPF